MRPTLSQIRGLGDFATTYNWYIQFNAAPAGINGQDINLRAESSDVPKKTGQSIPIQIRGLPPVKQPGIYTPVGTLTLQLNETIDGKISEIISKWQEMCYETNTGKGKKKSEVEAQVRLVRLDRADRPIWEYVLIGAFLEDYDNGQLQGSGSENMKPSMILSYDDFTQRKL